MSLLGLNTCDYHEVDVENMEARDYLPMHTENILIWNLSSGIRCKSLLAKLPQFRSNLIIWPTRETTYQ